MTILQTENFIDLSNWGAPLPSGTGTYSLTLSGGVCTATATQTTNAAEQFVEILEGAPTGSSTNKLSAQFTFSCTPSASTVDTHIVPVLVFVHSNATGYGLAYQPSSGSWFWCEYSSLLNMDQGTPVQSSPVASVSSGTHVIEYLIDNSTAIPNAKLYIDGVWQASLSGGGLVSGLPSQFFLLAGVWGDGTSRTQTNRFSKLTFADAMQTPINQPNAPILTAHAPILSTASATLAWTFSDSDGTKTQAAYRVVITRADTGALVLDTGQVSSASGSYTLAANTLTPGYSYVWSVSTWDNNGVQGPFANSTVRAGAAPTVVITSPVSDGTVIPTSQATVAWTTTDPANLGQGSYQVQLTTNADVVLEDTGQVADTQARSKTMVTALTNGTTYKLKVTVWNADGFASTQAVRTFSPNTVAPPTPTTTATPNSGGYVAIAITNPAPGGGVPDTDHNDVYRRVTGSTPWTRIATGVAKNGTYSDYAAALNTGYDYYVAAVAASLTTASSTTHTATLTLASGLFLHSVSNPSGTILALTGDESRSEDLAPAISMLQFLGRSRPVAEFPSTDYATNSISVHLHLTSTDANYTALRSLVQQPVTLCYRDQRGRRYFGNAPDLKTVDGFGDYGVDFTFQETAYSEAV